MPIIAAVDALSDALRVLRLTGAVFIDSEFTAPWCVHSQSHDPGSPVSGPDIVFFHVLTEGRCKARLLGGGETLDFAAGDLVMLPRDDPHLLGSDLRLTPTPADTLVQPAASGELMRIKHGGDGEKTRLICGFLRCDERLCGPMLDSLPRLLRVPLGDEAGAAWLRSLLHAGTRESSAPRPGGETVLAKLSELLFVEALRRYIELLPDEQKGWLAGLRDRFVGRALSAQRRARGARGKQRGEREGCTARTPRPAGIPDKGQEPPQLWSEGAGCRGRSPSPSAIRHFQCWRHNLSRARLTEGGRRDP